MDLKQQILVECLGLADALWWPIRDPKAPWWAAVWILRKRYPEQGMPWRGDGDKEHERALAECVRAGWVIRRRARRKTVGARLTDAGMREVRRLVGHHPYSDVIVLDEVLRKGKPGMWIPEITFNDNRGWGDGHHKELKVIDATSIPALVTGLVQANCLMRGQVIYRATGKPRPKVAPAVLEAGAPKEDPEAFAVYCRALREGIAWLDAQDNTSVGARGEIGELYLPTRALLAYREAGGYLPIEETASNAH